MNNDDKTREDSEQQPRPGPDDDWRSGNKRFAELEENEEFEESDRDSDFAAIYTEVEEEEEDEPLSDSWENGGSWEEEDVTPPDPEPLDQPEQDTWSALSALREDAQDFDVPSVDPEPDDTWEEEPFEDEVQREINLPLGLILVGIIALVLLGAGGYGVIQDRAALQEEIRQLQGSLATAASPDEVAETRNTSRAMASQNQELEQQVADLSDENRNLQSIIQGLETQLQAQQEALEKSPASSTAPEPKPAPQPRKVVSEPAAQTPVNTTTTSGSWFVNFGSYSQRPTAEAWTGRLKPAAGDVVVTTGEKSGRTFYRVRVVNLGSEEEANRVARTLEAAHKLPRLWVGRSP